MQIQEGGSYKLLYRGTEAWCTVHELYQYQGHYGVFGSTTRYQPHTFRGYHNVPGRPIAFPVINTLEQASLARFCASLFMAGEVYLETSPDVLTGSRNKVLIPNVQPLPGWHWYGTTTKGINLMELKETPRQLINLWFHWQEHGRLPAGYISAIKEARNGVKVP